MTIYLVIVTHNTGRNIVSIDAYQTLEDAHARKERAQANFPQGEGYQVNLIEQPIRKYTNPIPRYIGDS